MSRFGSLNIEGIEPQTGSAEHADLIHGTPVSRLWEIEDAGNGTCAGVWESTPGKWRFANRHWEYFRVLSGVSIITEVDGASHTVRTGDSLVLRAGFEGTWEVIETTRKEYVIRE